ncbi:MAG: sensor histidine kinase [Mesorhizobium sp.]|nr:sensor histidine kinase [Mesorhizobium sp.]
MNVAAPLHAEAADGLALALIASSNAPLLLLDGELNVISASGSFCRTFEIAPASVPGARLAALGIGEWGVPQLGSLLKATAAGDAEIDEYEMDLKRAGRETRRLVLNAKKLIYHDKVNVRLLLAIADVTDARAAGKLKDDLLRDKAVLLQELQHRVANSLQIIASVLMMSARKVQSDESRAHLYDAHKRVMSVASVQQQLAVSQLGDVHLRAYFTKLCDSLGASMIRDHELIRLSVTADDSMSSPDVSVSLGLIVTELVINALKHAFPGQRKGTITVDYRAADGGWTLSIVDDGVGIPLGPTGPEVKAGLGTSIVAALADQLQATVRIVSAEPGTSVSIVHVKSEAASAGAASA